MCLAIPGKIVELLSEDRSLAVVDARSQSLELHNHPGYRPKLNSELLAELLQFLAPGRSDRFDEAKISAENLMAVISRVNETHRTLNALQMYSLCKL